MEPTKLRVKIGVHEFEGEGPTEQITSLYNDWLERIASQPTEPPTTQTLSKQKPVIPAEKVTEVRTGDGYTGMLDIFEMDEARDLCKLVVHPPAGDTRDPDAILLVLYGYRKCGNQGSGTPRVNVTKVKQSLDISGIGVARVDRAAKPYLDSRYILKAGRGKGGVYELTVTGLARAEELANRLFAERVG